ncbi:MAG: 3-phosphoserine/phosphohydroxythreonine transaminase [Gammaproteobacteria bacterium]|nr:3-phosphoserine/phosphohydroxythreonine transaminase [Gammaproteobacteria bacterium]MDH3412431.1 3-phosphoserine/phosphohydroxythreonine transaminase [Gammaproteobacteria bacterium]
MSRVYNFGAGPAALPEPVLQRARDELLEWRDARMSVMEMSHRGAHFGEIAKESETRLRRLLSIPESYKVLFLQGGAQLQFSAVPLNLLRDADRADYVDTGQWSSKAIAEAKRYCSVNVCASARDCGYSRVPAESSWQKDKKAAYLHYTPNETIGGVEFHYVPDSGTVPLVGDMSSNILSRPVPVERFGLIYAGAQKNIGIAGLTVVIVREDLLGKALKSTPSMLDYKVQAEAGSLANTAPTFAWYVAGLVFEWLEAEGGIAEMEKRNEAKAKTLYEAIDASDFYSNPIDSACRSRMNVPFKLASPELDGAFLQEARAAGLEGLKGHRSVGGMRASLYNAMRLEGVKALVAFMADFEKGRG